MNRSSQRGFGAAAGILVIVVVIVIGVLGYVYFSQPSKDQSAEPKSPDTNAAAKVVKDSYDAYGRAAKDGDNVDGAAAFYKNTTPGLATKLQATTGFDSILCAQNVPSSIEYGTPSIAAGNIAVAVTTKWEASADAVIHVVVDGTSNKISSITCPEM